MFHPNCTVSLYRRLRYTDGKSSFGLSETFSGCLILHQQSFAAGSGLREEEKSLLYLPCDANPAPGDEVLIGSRRYTIGTVRQCCDLQGNLRACRCSFISRF